MNLKIDKILDETCSQIATNFDSYTKASNEIPHDALLREQHNLERNTYNE